MVGVGSIGCKVVRIDRPVIEAWGVEFTNVGSIKL